MNPVLPPSISRLRNAKDAASRGDALQLCAQLPLNSPAQLLAYHDAILNICAFPLSRMEYDTAIQQLERIAALLGKRRHNRRWQFALSNSGLPCTAVHCQYSRNLVQWLLSAFPGTISFTTENKTEDTGKQLLQDALPGVEFYAGSQDGWSLLTRAKWLSGARNTNSAVQWLLQLLDQQPLSPALKDLLYDQLQLFVSWQPAAGISRSFLRGPQPALYVQPFNKTVTSSRSVLNSRGIRAVELNAAETTALLSTIRSSLALYCRETDPVTFADISETRLFNMGRGVQIALTGVKKERRLSLETYIGYMAFKNGIPVAYGGGWVFGYRCKIGISMYPPFRGGVAAPLFCEVMRLYRQQYNIRCFVVRPYQFGKGNPDGIKSGAFWFYYKLGFRPVDTALRQLAREEWQRIQTTAGYRSPAATLKKFTAGNLEWHIEKTTQLLPEAETYSKAISEIIRSRFNGNRQLAAETCIRELRQCFRVTLPAPANIAEQKLRINFSLLFAALPEAEKWTQQQQNQFLKLMKLRSHGSDREFILAFQQLAILL